MPERREPKWLALLLFFKDILLVVLGLGGLGIRIWSFGGLGIRVGRSRVQSATAFFLRRRACVAAGFSSCSGRTYST